MGILSVFVIVVGEESKLKNFFENGWVGVQLFYLLFVFIDNGRNQFRFAHTSWLGNE